MPSIFFLTCVLRWGITNTEIKVTLAENPEQSEVLSFKFGESEGQNIALHASPAGRNSIFFFVFVRSTLFFTNPLQTQKMMYVLKSNLQVTFFLDFMCDFFVAFEDFRSMFEKSIPACTFFFFQVELRLHTLIPLFRLGSVHGGLVS